MSPHRSSVRFAEGREESRRVEEKGRELGLAQAPLDEGLLQPQDESLEAKASEKVLGLQRHSTLEGSPRRLQLIVQL